jgi:site-specific DNA-methyltransferase (adenine-specific)
MGKFMVAAEASQFLLRQQHGEQIRLLDVPVELCVHSRFNTRKTRSDECVQRLAERIRRNGFERTRALWAVERDAQYDVFAGGTRLEAARRAGLTTVPVFVHEGLTDDQVSRKADEDNENDEYHIPVPIVDVWAEYARLHEELGWSQRRIAAVKEVAPSLVSERIKWHRCVPPELKDLVGGEEELRQSSTRKFGEKHLRHISTIVLPVELFSWLTTEQAQVELVREVLAKHCGSSQGIRPSVHAFEEAAKRWKGLVRAVTEAYISLPEGASRSRFVQQLADEHTRSEAAVSRILHQVVDCTRREEEAAAARLRAELDEKQRTAEKLKQEQARLAFLTRQTDKLLHGDARELIARAPAGFHLLLTDPPYGMDFQSNRRTATPKRERIANDVKEDAFRLLADVLEKAHPLMAADAVCLIFTGWRYEPEFRQIITAAGFTIKGSLIWGKNNHGAGDLEGTFAPQHERIIHAVKGNPKLQTRAPDLLFGKEAGSSGHPMEKPRDLLRQLIVVTTAPGDVVVDPFFGSGNTVVEAMSLGRDFFGIELDEEWHRTALDTIHRMAEERFAHGLAV